MLNSGFQLTKPHDFYKRLVNIMEMGLGVDDDDDDDDDDVLEALDEKIEEINLTPDEEDLENVE